jgi:hypothetical protein
MMIVLLMVEQSRRINGGCRIVGRRHGRSLFRDGQIHGMLMMGRKLFHVRVHILRVEDWLVLVRREKHVVQEVDVGASTEGTVQRMIRVVHLCFDREMINTNVFMRASLRSPEMSSLRSPESLSKDFEHK